MKKSVITSLLMVLALSINAQILYNDNRDDFHTWLTRTSKFHKHIAANHITDAKIYSYSHKHPQGLLVYETKYNLHGDEIENIAYNKHGHIKYHYTYQYNDSNWVTSSVEFQKNNKRQSGRTWSYDKWGNITKSINWWKDTGNIIYEDIVQYDSHSNPLKGKIYYARGKLHDSIAYQYYDDGSKKKTTTYNRKGKITGIWNYDCNPIGKSEESNMKDTSKVCVHYETDKNGNPVKIKEEYTEGGGLFKYRLRKISKYDKDNHIIEQTITKLNGKEKSHSSYDFDAQGNITESRQYIPNSTTIKKRFVYAYDNSGNMIQITAYKSSVQGSVIKYVYN